VTGQASFSRMRARWLVHDKFPAGLQCDPRATSSVRLASAARIPFDCSDIPQNSTNNTVLRAVRFIALQHFG
jgi:hypothetical protein